MKRREFIELMGGVAIAWPFGAQAQQSKVPLMGYLHSGSPSIFGNLVAAFHQGLNEAGYVEGQNVAITYRWAEGQYDRLPALASELMDRQVAVIVTGGGEVAALAAKAATATIPIVFTIGSDPVKSGLVASLNHPGGNLTGATVFNTVLTAKELGLLHELVPWAGSVAMLVNPDNPNAELMARDVHEAGRVLGVDIHVLRAASEREIEAAFIRVSQLRPGGFLLGADALFHNRREQIVSLVARHAVPAIYFEREFAEVGGLLSYATRFEDAYHQVGVYAGQILKGAKPGDLPVQQPTRFELVINLKTAQQLGLTVPPTLLARADEVIE
jgi:putative ABC transport system substrate-binding protein